MTGSKINSYVLNDVLVCWQEPFERERERESKSKAQKEPTPSSIFCTFRIFGSRRSWEPREIWRLVRTLLGPMTKISFILPCTATRCIPQHDGPSLRLKERGRGNCSTDLIIVAYHVLQYRRISFVLSKGSRMIRSFQRKFPWFLFMFPGLPLTRTVLATDSGKIDEGFEGGTKETASAAVNFPPCCYGCKPCRYFTSSRGCQNGDDCRYCHAEVHIFDQKKYQCKRNQRKKKKLHQQTQENDKSSI